VLRYSAWEHTGIGGLPVSVVRCLVTSCGDAYNDTCPRQEVSGNRGDPGVEVLYGTKSVLI